MKHSMSHQGYVPSGRTTKKDGGPIQVRLLASGGVSRRSSSLLVGSAPRKVQPHPPLQPAQQHPQQKQQQQLQQIQPYTQRNRRGLEGGQNPSVTSPSVRSLGTGQIRISSFACGTLHHCEDSSVYFEDDTGNERIQHDREVEDLVVKLSKSLPLTQTSTCDTSSDDTFCTTSKLDSTKAESVLILDSPKNTIVEEVIDPPQHHWQYLPCEQSTAIVPSSRQHRERSTSKGKLPKPPINYSYQHIIRNFLNGDNACYVGDDDASSLGTSYDGNLYDDNYKNRSSAFLQGCVSPRGITTSTGLLKRVLDADTLSPISPIRSLMRASFPKSLFVPAYDDTNANNGADFENEAKNGSYTAITMGQREVQFFKRRLDHATKYYGKVHSQTADASFNLGQAQLRTFQYDLALENFTRAHAICRSLHREDRFHLSIGRALDAMGLAVLRSSAKQQQPQGKHKRMKALQEAQRLLEQSFAIRHHHLGVWHVDTVETYNRLASVQLHLGRLHEACHAYQEVYYVRQAIFGRTHPSVAISAHSVANCYYKLGGPQHLSDSLEWYQRALDIYEAMALPYRHPAVARLLKDRSRLEKYVSLG